MSCVALPRYQARTPCQEEALLDLAEQQRFAVRWLRAGTKRDRALERDVKSLEQRVDHIEARLERE